MKQLNQVFHEVAGEGASNNLKELARHLGWGEDEIIVIAVNRMFWNVFEPNAEYDYPTEEELAKWEQQGLIQRVDKGKKSQHLLDFFKKHGVED